MINGFNGNIKFITRVPHFSSASNGLKGSGRFPAWVGGTIYFNIGYIVEPHVLKICQSKSHVCRDEADFYLSDTEEGVSWGPSSSSTSRLSRYWKWFQNFIVRGSSGGTWALSLKFNKEVQHFLILRCQNDNMQIWGLSPYKKATWGLLPNKNNQLWLKWW